MQDLRRLKLWRDAHAFRLDVYRAVRAYPASERSLLVTQTCRSASSIGWNIAEGCGRGSDADFARFLQIANGSASECLDQLIQARDLGYLAESAFMTLSSSLREICRQLIAFMRHLRRRS